MILSLILRWIRNLQAHLVWIGWVGFPSSPVVMETWPAGSAVQSLFFQFQVACVLQAAHVVVVEGTHWAHWMVVGV